MRPFDNDFGQDGIRSRGARVRSLSRVGRLPVIFGFTVVVFGILFVCLSILLANANPAVSARNDDRRERVVVVEKEPQVQMTNVLIPIGDIEQGKKLEPSMFRIEKRASVAISGETLKSFEELKGNYARSIIPANQVISKGHITSIKPPNPVIASIPPGFRAVTISVNATTAVEGWASAGAMVDVQWISDILGERTASTIVQNAKVLSAERQVEGAQPNGQPIPTTVTLMVNERDAQRISLATSGGSIMLHLRGANDTGKGTTTGTLTFKDLVGKGARHEREDLDGYAKATMGDGSTREWALVGGKLISKKKE